MTGPLVDLGPVLPAYSPITIPDLPSLGLTQDEKDTVSLLMTRQWRGRAQMLLGEAYYRGEQLITDLGIAIPPELNGLRTLVAWGRIPIDPLAHRLCADGFRLPGETDVDPDLSAIWNASHMYAEQALAYIDALVKGRSWLIAGADPAGGEYPLIAVESPLNVSALWDVRSLKPKALLQTYWVDVQRHAALHLPDRSVYIAQDDVTMQWTVQNRDNHGFGLVPAVRMPNKPESDKRDGTSELTPELMSLIDAGCRALIRTEVGAEFFAAPQKYILGASEGDFQNADGTAKSAWKTYISHVLALENDENGNAPTVGQFQSYDPTPNVKIVEMLASQFAGATGAPPQELGLYTQGNPISADALQVSEARRDRYARHKQAGYTRSLVEIMQIALRFQNSGDLPSKYEYLEVDWRPPETLNLTGVTDAMTKAAAAGMVAATSDVVLGRMGFTANERVRLEQDRKLDEAQQTLAELAKSEQAKLASADNRIATELKPPAAPSPAAGVPGRQPPNVKPAGY